MVSRHFSHHSQTHMDLQWETEEKHIRISKGRLMLTQGKRVPNSPTQSYMSTSYTKETVTTITR